MSTSLVLPLMADGTLPPAPVLLRWLAGVARQGIHQVRLDRLPPGNGSLPDLLADAGIERLSLLHPPFPQPFRWQGWCGGQVVVGAGDQTTVVGLHHGELPWSACSGPLDHAMSSAFDQARLDDAHALLVATAGGAAWDQLLAGFTAAAAAPSSDIQRASAPTANVTAGRLGAWNPLALARRTVVALPVPPDGVPAGLRDQRGARHAVQPIDGPGGRGLLTSLALGALEAVLFEPLDEAVPGSHWEVTPTVIDNGRVRAELDALGRVVRLCCDGRFVDWAGPALQAMVGDQPLSGTCTISVLESGPIRGRIVVTRSGGHGTLRLTYSLHAHEPVLRLSVAWDGDTDLRLECPTMVQAAPLEAGGELSGWSVPQHARADGGRMAAIAGLRWARLREADQRGLAVFGLQPMRVSAAAGRLSLHIARSASIALCESAWPNHAPGIAPLSLSLATPAVAAGIAIAPRLRLVGDGVIPWWLSRPDDWAGEVLLGQPHALRARCILHVNAGEAVRMDGRGGATALRRTGDGDGFEVELGTGEVATVRWR